MHAEICGDCKCCNVTQGFICLSYHLRMLRIFLFRNYFLPKIEIMFIDTYSYASVHTVCVGNRIRSTYEVKLFDTIRVH
jgi:hypothetical protein